MLSFNTRLVVFEVHSLRLVVCPWRILDCVSLCDSEFALLGFQILSRAMIRLVITRHRGTFVQQLAIAVIGLRWGPQIESDFASMAGRIPITILHFQNRLCLPCV